MKEKLGNMLTAAMTTIFILALTGIAKAGTLAMPNLDSGAPTVVSYQGQVVLEGTPYDDDGYFKFAVVNEGGDYTYWSNDGSSESGEEPAESVRLVVSKGLFNVLLGDTNLENMIELEAHVFDEIECYLRVWFSPDGGESFYQLDPDRRVAAVPYALQAQEALEASNADTVDGEHAYAFADAAHNHTPGNISPQGSGSGLDPDTVDGEHASDLELPSGSMVLGASANETALINAGFSNTGQILDNYWSNRTDMPTGRSGLAVAVVDGIIYAIGGKSSINEFETTNEAYNPLTDSWSTKAPMPTGRSSMAIAVVDGIIYVIGGLTSGSFEDTINEAYDPLTDSWTVKAPMPTGRRSLVAAAVDGVIYAIGGTDYLSSSSVNEAYDPATDTWSTKSSMLTGRRYSIVGAVDGIIYVIGGQSSATAFETVNEAYDPATDSWSTKAAMPTGRRFPTAGTLDGSIYVIGGNSDENDREKVNEAYNPLTNTWSIKQRILTGRNAYAVTVNDFIFLIGGSTSYSAYEKTIEVSNPMPRLYIYHKP